MKLLRSKIGREIFLLSSMTAILPLVFVGWIAMSRLNEAYMGRTADYLEESARNFGRQFYDRLLGAIDMVEIHGEGDAEVLTSDAVMSLWSFPLDSDELGLSSKSIDELDQIALNATRPAVYFDGSAEPTRTFVVVPLDAGALVAELAETYLWGDPAEYPYAVDFCALAKGVLEPVYCSAPIPTEVVRSIQLNRELSASVIWDGIESGMSSSYWEMFTRSSVDGPLIRLVASQSVDVAMAPWRSLQSTYVPGLIATLALVVLVATSYVRRFLRPINSLVDATRKFGEGDFSHVVSVSRQDEFRDLANSMNAMAANIEAQFRTLELLSDIDRLVLEGNEIDEVVRLILRYAMRVEYVATASILLLDPQAEDAAIAHSVRRGEETYAVQRIAFSPIECVVFERPAVGPVRMGAGELPGLVGKVAGSDGLTYVWPIHTAEKPTAALILSLEESCRLHAGDEQRICEFARRLSVALELIQRESRLIETATIDALTGLPNRHLLLDRLNQELVRVRQQRGQLVLAFIDLDRFKQVNDTYGHAKGDSVLKEAALRLTKCVRETDTVARLGGDEFVILLPTALESEDVSPRLDAVLATLSEPFRVGVQEFFLSASIGVARYPKHGTTAEELLRKADTAMYGAKNDGRGKSVDFSQSMEIRVTRRMQLESELRKALDNEELELVYQPQVSLQTNLPVSVEALLRWNHPSKGLIPPLDFIPAAEDSGYINVLGAWVLADACKRQQTWIAAGLPVSRVAVNVSARQFELADFVSQVRDRLEVASVAPNYLELEITESVFLSGIERVRKKLDEIRSMGVTIAIDDFGTGFSSLSYIRDLPFDVIKIDRAFISDLPMDRDACAIVKAITVMAQALGKQIVAEGVETEAQRQFLCEQGVELGQGYFFGKPMNPAAVEELFRNQAISRFIA